MRLNVELRVIVVVLNVEIRVEIVMLKRLFPLAFLLLINLNLLF